MAIVNISEAIKLSGVSRQTFYSKYIDKGKITVSEDNLGKKCIDTAELLRVFGVMHTDNVDKTGQDSFRQVEIASNTQLIAGLEKEVQLLREQMVDKNEQIQEYRQREQRLLDQVDKLTDTIRQVEHKPKAVVADPERPSWLVRVLTRKIW
jgi:hypothetical protein